MSNNYDVEGRIIKISEIEQISEKFRKSIIVINTGGEYPQFIPIEVVNDKIEWLEDFKVDDEVKVFFNLRGNAGKGKHEGRYFVSLQLWKIETPEKKTWNNEPEPKTWTNKEEAQFLSDDIPF